MLTPDRASSAAIAMVLSTFPSSQPAATAMMHNAVMMPWVTISAVGRFATA
jgi:hypothetical protein